MTKRILAGALSLALAAGLLVGCGGSASSAPALDEEESAKIAEALNSSSGDLSPGSNAVQPGAMGAAAGA